MAGRVVVGPDMTQPTTEAPIGLAPHPAVFNDKVLVAIRDMLKYLSVKTILDPFAGVGRIHELRPMYETYGVEIEPEWADYYPQWTTAGDSVELEDVLAAAGFPERYDAVVTSPVYGNRMSDHHDAKDGSKRNTYRHKLGRALHPNNAGQMQWGREYRNLHSKVWKACTNVIHAGWAADSKPDGYFILNIKDHIRSGERIEVAKWHVNMLHSLGWKLAENQKVKTRGNRYGANADLRVDFEYVLLFERQHG